MENGTIRGTTTTAGQRISNSAMYSVLDYTVASSADDEEEEGNIAEDGWKRLRCPPSSSMMVSSAPDEDSGIATPLNAGPDQVLLD